MSSSSRFTDVRSGTSLMKSTAISAPSAKGRATRKMWPVASPYALSKIARIGAGIEETSGTPPFW